MKLDYLHNIVKRYLYLQALRPVFASVLQGYTALLGLQIEVSILCSDNDN